MKNFMKFSTVFLLLMMTCCNQVHQTGRNSTVVPSPLSEIQRLDMERRRVETRHKEEAIVTEKRLGLDKVQENKLFRESFKVNDVPTGDLFAFSAEIEIIGGGVSVNFETLCPSREIMGHSQMVVLDGDIVGARIPDKVTVNARVINCVAEGFRDVNDAKSWIEARLKPVPVVNPNDPNDPRKDYRMIRFDVDSGPPIGSFRRIRSTQYHWGGSFVPSDFYRLKYAWILDGKIYCKKEAVQNVRREPVF